MANIKITDLTAYGDPASTDVLPIVDVGADVTKKVSVADLLENAGSGTASAPGIAFDGDSNTGIYRPGADQVAISTGGAQRLLIDSDGDININGGGVFYDATNKRLGIGTTNPVSLLNVQGTGSIVEGRIGNNTSTVGQKAALYLSTSPSNSYNSAGIEAIRDSGSTDVLAFIQGTTEKARIDGSGRLLVGTTSQSGGSLLQVNDNRIRIASSKTPASASDTGTAGEICWDAAYIYVCTATNTWKRAALSTW